MEGHLEVINSVEEYVRLLEEGDGEASGARRTRYEEAPLEVWFGIVEQHPEWRDWVVGNKTVPVEVLELLSKDPDPGVRVEVASRRKLPESLFWALAADPDPEVRRHIAANPKAPWAVLRRLVDDPVLWVAAAAVGRLAWQDRGAGGDGRRNAGTCSRRGRQGRGPDVRPALDVLTDGLALPPGCDEWAFRLVNADLTSTRGMCWPWPGGVAEAAGPFVEANAGPWPQAPGDGLTAAFDFPGTVGGRFGPTRTVLVVAFAADAVLGRDRHGVRAKRFVVVAVADLHRSVRLGGFAGADLSWADLSGADLRGADLRGADLRGADLSGADLEDADLSGADLRRAALGRAMLGGAGLRGADLVGAGLERARLWCADLRDANLTGAEASDATFGGADLGNADLTGAGLSGAAFGGTKMNRAVLAKAGMVFATLEDADLRGADLTGANLRRAWLERVDFRGAKLDGADLEDAVWDDETRWPDGHNPRADGRPKTGHGEHAPQS
ncbi:MAG: pentapeptide repeat-containing protein [Bifidobacteriaceae bacterium]|jgi:uncharacterized protein YjbI with pentapeptide repeats|nr:pentapeptide repeat-containing protein [Bifidobacteriaceae bacterium]